MSTLYRRVDLEDLGPEGESEPVVYVGVYVLRWGKEDQPSVGFVDVDIDALSSLYDACLVADVNGELAENINGELLDAAADALKAAGVIR